jgi:uncharacterized NAD(P)/FAD-binding protein YdhS
MLNVAIVGTGPTGIYTLKALLRSRRRLRITLYEAAPLAGVGMPYSDKSTEVVMLANIASIEIPAVTETYLDWLKRQPAVFLSVFGVQPDDLDSREFLPRMVLGGYYRDQMERLVDEAARRGHGVRVLEHTRVTDIRPEPAGVTVDATTADGARQVLTHDRVVIATGHVWPDADEPDRQYFLSPWSGLPEADIPPARIGVMGTSLSGLDVAMAVASQHGRFVDDPTDGLRYVPSDPACKPLITLMSRGGLLPEADFWCPLPYRPLTRMTEEAVAAEIARGADGLLDRMFDLFRAELATEAARYSRRIGLVRLDADSFADAYFAPRKAGDPFAHAAQNLEEVERNLRLRRTVRWRYAILRMHEAFAPAVLALTEADLARFDRGLKRVFVDNYAAIPPASIRRMIALHAAGVLTVLALGDAYEVERAAQGVRIVTDRQTHAFDVFVDARGQRKMTLSDLPYPGLVTALRGEDGQIGRDLSVTGGTLQGGRVWLPASPYLLERRPFVQGITASAEMGATVARSLIASARRPRLRTPLPLAAE